MGPGRWLAGLAPVRTRAGSGDSPEDTALVWDRHPGGAGAGLPTAGGPVRSGELRGGQNGKGGPGAMLSGKTVGRPRAEHKGPTVGDPWPGDLGKASLLQPQSPLLGTVMQVC